MEINDIKQNLYKAGFSEKESAIYSCLLELGGAYPSKIAEKTGINRSTVYKILLELSIKGLVTEIEKSKKLFYQIEKPQKMISYAKNRIALAEDGLEKIKRIIPSIEGIFGSHENKPQVRYFEGEEGILNIYSEHINVKKPYEMLAMSNANSLFKILDTDFFINYRKAKETVGITTRGLLPDTLENRGFNKIAYEQLGINKKYWPHMKFVPIDKYILVEGEITLFDNDKVSIVNFKDGLINGTVIKDRVIFDMMKIFFELSWNSSDIKE
jgi:sugar-specific transcriptional regulator TrmB